MQTYNTEKGNTKQMLKHLSLDQLNALERKLNFVRILYHSSCVHTLTAKYDYVTTDAQFIFHAVLKIIVNFETSGAESIGGNGEKHTNETSITSEIMSKLTFLLFRDCWLAKDHCCSRDSCRWHR